MPRQQDSKEDQDVVSGMIGERFDEFDEESFQALKLNLLIFCCISELVKSKHIQVNQASSLTNVLEVVMATSIEEDQICNGNDMVTSFSVINVKESFAICDISPQGNTWEIGMDVVMATSAEKDHIYNEHDLCASAAMEASSEEALS